VDDSAIIVERLRNMLEDSKNIGPIWQAGDYSSAVRQLAESQPDIALLDINLPGKSGIALLQYIKSVYPSIIIIMISNQEEDFYRKICLRMGANFYIDKSKEIDLLPSVISTLF
jgi:DNA-binding NarL/FixJ family response regulator